MHSTGRTTESVYLAPALTRDGDRAVWAVRDVLRKRVQRCKFRPELLLCVVPLRAHARDMQ